MARTAPPIPSTFKVGRKLYFVHHVAVRYGGRYGWHSPAINTITVAHTLRGLALPVKEQTDTFWHEVTHAILYDMKHPQAGDEQFVAGFAKRLNQVIWSAEF